SFYSYCYFDINSRCRPHGSSLFPYTTLFRSSLVALTVAVLAALCTYSRAAWLGLVVAVGVFGALRLGAGIQRLLRPSAGTDTSTMNRRLVGAGVLVVVLAGLFFAPRSPVAISRAEWSAAQRALTT